MKVVLSILVFSATVYSQRLYVGVKGGTPLSDSMASAFVGGRGGSGLSTLNVRRYTLGPTVELRVWRNISVEADALYKRLDRTEHRFFAPTFGSIDRLTASSWELPFLLKYSCPKLKFQPFVAAGGAVRVFLPAEASTETIATGFQPPRSVTRYDPD